MRYGPGSEALGPRRRAVPADGDWFDDEGEAGSAGVREPRRPKPVGPSMAAEMPEPEPPTYVKLADARR
jgi:hypothetical protein